VTLAWNREPDNLSPRFGGSGGGNEFEWVFSSGLTYFDLQGINHPMMARQIPSQDNRDWVVNPDGTMVTIYRLRDNLRWHDGVPVTAEDFAFAYRVYRDPAVPIHNPGLEQRMSAVEAHDDQTLVIRWSEAYIHANGLENGLPPLPRHQLLAKYNAARADFGSGEEWTSAYVGSGPFRMDRWEPGVRIVARAYRDWFMGAPRLETVEFRFISDPSTVLANLMAGEVDVAARPTVRLSEAVAARPWVARGEGYLKTWAIRLNYLDFQYREVPNWQRAVTDLRVRQALSHAINRTELGDAITDGLGRVADAWILPEDPIFTEVDRVVTKYPFDPQRALALLADAGWRPQPGGRLTNVAGESLDVEVNSQSIQPEVATIIGDNWKTLGVNASVYILAAARLNDREFRASFPGTAVGGRTVAMDGLHLISSLIPTRESGFRESNRGSFSDAEVDRLQNLAVTSFDESIRRQAAIDVNKRLSEIAAYAPLFYYPDVLLARTRVRGPLGQAPMQNATTWNIFEWEVTD
jgi:peptide/nickel transport system substrate-binding protein